MERVNLLGGRIRNLAKTLAAPFGITGYNYYLLRTLKHPDWIYRARGKIPFRRLEFPDPIAVSQSDLTLCERLIAAYRKATKVSFESREQSPVWSRITQRHRQALVKALGQADPRPLATILATMFRQEFTYGIASGPLFRDAQTWIGSRIWSLKFLDDLVSLAEGLGVVRTECPEQGVSGYAFLEGVEQLVERIESSVAVSLEFPEVGAPYGFRIGPHLITMELPEHLYAAIRINHAINAFLDAKSRLRPNLIEIGGGFGGTANWLLTVRRGEVSSYRMIDLPLTNVLQGYFLSKALGEATVSFFGESLTDLPEAPQVQILPPSAVEHATGEKIEVLINQNSMPEIPEPAVNQYLEWSKRNLRGIFYSYNQEAYSPVGGVPQVFVPQMVAQVGGFERVSRTHSWLRRGYVEEIYILQNTPSL